MSIPSGNILCGACLHHKGEWRTYYHCALDGNPRSEMAETCERVLPIPYTDASGTCMHCGGVTYKKYRVCWHCRQDKWTPVYASSGQNLD